MSELAKTIGKRIRNHRTKLGLSQEKLAELSGCHPTYIGQLERGEKNATIESIDRIATSLNIPLSRLFENLGGTNIDERNIPLECYDFLLSKTRAEQEQLLKILIEMDKYKDNI
ncbi:MAG: helix-turn-helix transcriptional regulator [Clostridia bacterium]|nr:helix-turn-helix transcriptional regulator [Oscillospiraceae bacterium]MBQ1954492.1 helix-turn-helix transcriptional regulator [Clostridia bacterium]